MKSFRENLIMSRISLNWFVKAVLLYVIMVVAGTSLNTSHPQNTCCWAFSLFSSPRPRIASTFSSKVPSSTLLFMSTNNKKNRPGKNEQDDDAKRYNKEELVKAVGESMRKKRNEKNKTETKSEKSLLDRINPFKAGQELRKNIDQALSSLSTEQDPSSSYYYLDDRIFERSGTTAYTRRPTSSTGPLAERIDQDDYIPEVLVVGATGEVGRLVVRRLLLDGRFRVRVLVRNLYTSTLELFGTGVTYCQGDLNNIDSLEYALTDVDKIVFCAGAPKPDEEQFQRKFQDFVQENLKSSARSTDSSKESESTDLTVSSSNKDTSTVTSDLEWEQLDSVLQVRAQLAQQVDFVGMQNLVRAYQDVRHADYGTSQSAKRTLFKFVLDRPGDFNLFSLDEEAGGSMGGLESSELADYSFDMADMESEFDDFEDYDGVDGLDPDDAFVSADVESRKDGSTQVQVQWIRNRFGHAVFVGRIPKGSGEASVASIRLRSRDDPGNGLDLSGTFAGFVARVCSDGGTYEAFIRTRTYEKDGIEYVCEFSTSTKPTGRNKSPNKFVTVRLPFESFKPVRTAEKGQQATESSIPSFRGGDVRQIGFRYRSKSNEMKEKLTAGTLNSFYLALSYVKLYRAQPEPEFIYLSDSNIPPVVRNGMVQHGSRQLLLDTKTSSDDGYTIFDENQLKSIVENKSSKSPEETYYKYLGEEILKRSGLSYAIVRVAGYSEAAGEASTIVLKPENTGMALVSRDDVAQVCVEALLDPNALNKSFYLSKKESNQAIVPADEDISAKFSKLPMDSIA